MGLNALMAAVILATTFSAQDAQALALGRLTIQSALGEPLVAEIDVPEITAGEASSLRVTVAPAQAYRAAGVEVNPTLANTDIRLLRRPDGKAFLRITNPRSINEPYLDLMLEASWASGRVVRDYTLLLDPPRLRAPAAPQLPPPVAAVVSAPVPQPALAPAPLAAVTAAPAPAPAAAPPVVEADSAAAPAKAPSVPAKAAPPAQAKTVAKPTARTPLPAKSDKLTVKAGDTAGRIAQANRPNNATLEQMLVAMLKANPQAFINGNVNLIRAGAIIDLPDEQATLATPEGEANQMIVAQSRDFNDFRQRLASVARPVATASPERKASGKVQAEVKDQRPSAQTPDQLKLSKGTVTSEPAAPVEDKIAQTRQAKAAADRIAELERNLAELTKLDAAANAKPAVTPPPPSAPAAATTVPAVTVAAEAPAVSAPAEPPPAPPEPTPAVVEPPKPAEAAAEPPAAAPVTAEPTTAPPPPVETAEDESGVLDSVLNNPLALPAAGGLVALLLGFGAYRLRQRKKHSSVDSSYLESRLPSDSFFGSSGGQKVDTAEAAVSGSSMMYSPSQLDVGGDVDPVAEADVYLAYGRDLQAEEILKEAMRITPSRVAIHCKMLEIYAKRRDTKAFEMLACEVYALAHGTGPDWDQACKLGQELDPTNPLYHPGGSPAVLASANSMTEDASPGMAMTQPFHDDDRIAEGSTDGPLDLDLDFSIDSPLPGDPVAQTDGLAFDMPSAPAQTADLSFDMDEPSPSTQPPNPANQSAAFDLTADDLSFALPDMDTPSAPTATEMPDADLNLHFDLPDEPPTAAAPYAAEQTTRMELPEPYDETPTEYVGLTGMDGLSLDLGDATGGDMSLDDIPDGDPLETKLSLASEFMGIGDEEGARALAEEVLEEATGPLKAKASAFLDNLG